MPLRGKGGEIGAGSVDGAVEVEQEEVDEDSIVLAEVEG